LATDCVIAAAGTSLYSDVPPVKAPTLASPQVPAGITYWVGSSNMPAAGAGVPNTQAARLGPLHC